MSRPVVVIVEPYSSGNMYAPALRRAGFSTCGVTLRSAAPLAASFRAEDFDHHLEYGADDAAPITPGLLDPVLERLRPLAPVAVLPGEQHGVRLADRLAAELTPDRANRPELAAARWHKGEMYAAVAAAGLPIVETLCTRDPEQVADWLRARNLAGRDLVVKPANASGTDGVTRHPGGAGWREAVTGLAGGVSRHGIQLTDVVVQEYVTGVEYAVDTFSHDGVHTVTDIVRYRKLHSGGRMAIYESMEFVPHDAPGHDELLRYTRQVLDALGVRFGVAHTEVMLTDRGPLLMEVNARPPGGAQPWACQLATGDNLIDRAVRHLAGESAVRPDYDLEMTVLVVFFSVRSAGRISGIAGLDAITALPSCYHLKVNVEDGDEVPETLDLMDAHKLGVAVLADPDPAQVAADHLEVRRIASRVGRPGGFTVDVAAVTP
ncbi:ATP-grasp domain-containing protein [Streptomyces novaecaesareae]|uniref:ATP-grasp domain-containing protein n=1 Tax=Streptomyces novaecaesareae TaxID=68244 RepID=UPI000690A674|nr:ATP-grasp domain-containing protein [Streptomyces novaecaesareae]